MSRPMARYSRGLISVSLAVGALALAGCTPQGSAPDTSSAGAAVVQRRCAVCHTLDRVESAKKDEAAWNATIDRMRTKGAVVSAAEQAQIIEYLLSR